jgi:YD repeat-containing protein
MPLMAPAKTGSCSASPQHQQIGGKTHNFSYGYNLAGALTSETYPSGRVATTTYDQGNRPVALSGNLGGVGKSYVNELRYWPNGLKYWTIYGNSVWNIWGA